MATYSLNINERTANGKALLNYLMSIGVVEPSRPCRKRGIDKAIEDFETGNTVKCKDFDDYLKKVNS